MTKEFEARVMREGIVDTEKYRYVYEEENSIIKRIPIEKLDTTDAFSGWEVVKEV